MKRVAGTLVHDYLPRGNLPFDIAPLVCPACLGTPVEIEKIGLPVAQRGNNPFHPPLISCFYDHVPPWEVFEQLSQGFSTVERHRHLLGIETRELEENMGSHGKNGGLHLSGVL